MTGQFTVRKHADGSGGVRIAVTGEIDDDASTALDLIICNAVAQPGVGTVTIDLERVPFLAAGGVRSLLNGRLAAMEHGCAFTVVNPHGIVRGVLDAVGLTGLLLPANALPAARKNPVRHASRSPAGNNEERV
jgi:anti-anti-sigma factor